MAELDVERGKVALQEGRTEDARDAAVRALAAGGDWRAHRLYLEASEQGGLSMQARAAYEILSLQDPEVAAVWRWHEISRGSGSPGDLASLAPDAPDVGHLGLAWLALGDGAPQMAVAFAQPVGVPEADDVRVRAHLADGAPKDALRAAQQAIATAPDHPEVLAALWHRQTVPGKVGKGRTALVEEAVAAALASPDPLRLYRAHAAAAAGKHEELAAKLQEALAAAGEPRPLLSRPAWDRATREDVGVELASGARSAEDLVASAAEWADVCRAQATALEDSGRLAEAVDGLAACRARVDAFGLAGLHARLLLKTDRREEAISAADRGLILASLPAADDLSRMDGRRQSQELAAAQATRGAALQGSGLAPDALAAFAIAAALDPGAEWAALRAQLAGAGAPGADGPAREANERAFAACLAGDPATCRAEADAALGEIARLPGSEAFRDADARGVLATALVIRATAREQSGDAEGALADATQSALIVPTEASYALRAELLEGLGHEDAAFVAWAVAQGMGAPAAEALPRTWRGWGDWEDAATAIVEVWKTANPDPLVRPPRKRGVRIGEPIPSFALETTSGPMTSADLEGKIIVLSFWASWCGPCMQELPKLDELSRKLAAEGAPVVILGVSTDDRIADYERIRKRPDLQAVVFSWNPELAAMFRVTGIPSTWVMDQTGTARFHHTGYGPGAEVRLEREIRELMAAP